MESKIAELSEDERCDIAEDIAEEEWFKICGKNKAFCKLGALLGIDNPEELLDKCDIILKEFEDESNREDICIDSSKVRSVVMCSAWKKMDTDEYSFQGATKEAWSEIKTKCSKFKI